MTRSYDPLVLVYVVLMYPCTSWDGTCTRLVLGTPRPLALDTVLQAALAWLPGVTPPVILEAGYAYDKVLLGALDGRWDGLVLVIGSISISYII